MDCDSPPADPETGQLEEFQALVFIIFVIVICGYGSLTGAVFEEILLLEIARIFGIKTGQELLDSRDLEECFLKMF